MTNNPIVTSKQRKPTTHSQIIIMDQINLNDSYENKKLFKEDFFSKCAEEGLPASIRGVRSSSSVCFQCPNLCGFLVKAKVLRNSGNVVLDKEKSQLYHNSLCLAKVTALATVGIKLMKANSQFLLEAKKIENDTDGLKLLAKKYWPKLQETQSYTISKLKHYLISEYKESHEEVVPTIEVDILPTPAIAIVSSTSNTSSNILSTTTTTKTIVNPKKKARQLIEQQQQLQQQQQLAQECITTVTEIIRDAPVIDIPIIDIPVSSKKQRISSRTKKDINHHNQVQEVIKQDVVKPTKKSKKNKSSTINNISSLDNNLTTVAIANNNDSSNNINTNDNSIDNTNHSNLISMLFGSVSNVLNNYQNNK